MNINDENDKNLLLNDEDNSLTENTSSNDELISNNETAEQTLLNDSEDTLLNDDEMPNNTPEINEIAEANESLATLDSDPYNLIKDVNLTLSSIEKKIDKETEQLSKLDQLEDIKNELKKMNTTNKIQEDNNDQEVSAQGDNLPDNSDLIVQIENLQEKIKDLETTNESYNERLRDIDETLNRFKEIEKELEIEVIEEDEKPNKKDDVIKNEKPKNKNLLILLIVLLFTISGVVILDALGIVNLYLTQTFKNIF